MDIRRATIDDLGHVTGIDHAVLGSDERFAKLESAIRDGHCSVATDGAEVLGYAIADRSFFGRPFLDLLLVHPDHRRKGVASALMERVEEECGGELFTSTNRSNAAMQALCESRGYVRSGVVENLDPGDPEIIFYKRLKT